MQPQAVAWPPNLVVAYSHPQLLALAQLHPLLVAPLLVLPHRLPLLIHPLLPLGTSGQSLSLVVC